MDLGLVSGIGNVLGGLLGMTGAQNQNASNAQQAVQMEQFQEQMSNTAHQREVADLKAAGLNPMLSVNAGASTPSGAMSSMVNTMQPVQQGMSGAVDALIKGKATNSQIDQNNSNIAVNASNKNYLDKRAVTETANAREANANADAAELQAQRIRAGQESALRIAPYQPYIDTAGKVVGIGVNALEGGSALGAAMKFMRSPVQKQGIPIGGLPSEFNGMSGQDLQDMAKQYKDWKAGKVK